MIGFRDSESDTPTMSDTSVFEPDPWQAGSVGAQNDSMDHNSSGTDPVGRMADSTDHNSAQIVNGDLAE